MLEANIQLNELSHKIHEWSKEKGFYDKPREIGTMLMLIVSELSEAMEADREDRYSEDFERFNWFNDWERGNKSNDCFNFHNYFKDTFEDELADTIIRILDLCGHLNIDIEKHIELKMKYNETRERMHGKKY